MRRCREGRGRFTRPYSLQRRIFMWFGLSILLSTGAAWLVFNLLESSGIGQNRFQRQRQFVAARYEHHWDSPEELARLTEDLAVSLGCRVELLETNGAVRAAAGEECGKPDAEIPILRDGQPIGTLTLCFSGAPGHGVGLLALLASCFVLWAASGRIARRLGRPVAEIANVTERIGQGRLDARVCIERGFPGELGALARSVNEMSSRIERQLKEQRELLAAVSHELRTPLTRLRILLELVRDGAYDERSLEEMEREIQEIDSLISELLANARIDFSALDTRPLDPVELARDALKRAHLSNATLYVESSLPSIEADANLLSRALANLLSNAERHGQGAESLRVAFDEDAVVFSVSDRGPGFEEELIERAFEPFVRSRTEGALDTSVGLGLSLVCRIAQAHGGRAWAENRIGEGATVSIRIPVTQRA